MAVTGTSEQAGGPVGQDLKMDLKIPGRIEVPDIMASDRSAPWR
jgi:hypothetical protein